MHNLPIKHNDEPFERNAEMAARLLKFRRRTQDAIDTLTIDMVQHRDPCAGIIFETLNGRPVLLAMAVGVDACAILAKHLHDKGATVSKARPDGR
jgi:hypothetical protein